MYLPGDDADERDAITAAFEAYAKRETEALGEKFQIRTAPAKIELPGDPEARVAAGAARLREPLRREPFPRPARVVPTLRASWETT